MVIVVDFHKCKRGSRRMMFAAAYSNGHRCVLVLISAALLLALNQNLYGAWPLPWLIIDFLYFFYLLVRAVIADCCVDPGAQQNSAQ